MEDVRKQDPTYTNYVPRNAAEAVERYVRCRKNGLKPMLVPECLIACAKGLQGEELDKFESWIINPNAELDNVKLVRTDRIREYNDSVYRENLRKFEEEMPPLPCDENSQKSSARTGSSQRAQVPFFHQNKIAQPFKMWD